MAIWFSKLLKKTDVEKRLSVSTKNSKSLGVNRRGMDLQVIDVNSELWTFRYLVRKGKYLKPVLSKGWLAFVRASKLGIGDKVTFHIVELGQANTGGLHLQYKIQVEKPVKIFGAVFGYI